jgi:DNA excision repair protein ERCC-2
MKLFWQLELYRISDFPTRLFSPSLGLALSAILFLGMTQEPFEISVRELAEFVHRRGDLGGESGFRRSNRALEGIKGHKRIQQSRGSDYRPEVTVSRVFTKSGVELKVVGRVDGVIEGLTPLVEEIKTVERQWSREADPVHLAQLKLYAGILAGEKGWGHLSLLLTYLELETDEVTHFREEVTKDDVTGFLIETVEEWFSWLLPYVEWLQVRNASAEKAPFPFTSYRAGQRELARSVYRAVQCRSNLFVEAPTGLGKTLAVLYPAIKAFPLIADAKTFYVTAKTPGRLAAEDALQKLRATGLQIRSLSLTAKAKICFAPDASGCDPSTCPFTKGYYDRYKPAMRELLSGQKLDRENISAVAQKHRVCPFELSLDVSKWVDVIIGDYNYVFDPVVMLQRYFGEGRAKHVVLVDEAHNLVDRSRDMYSAILETDELSVPPEAVRGKNSVKARDALASARDEILRLLRGAPTNVPPPKSYHRGAFASESLPASLVEILRSTTAEIEGFLVEQSSREIVVPWLTPFFAIHRFLQIAEVFDGSYRMIIDPGNQRITLFCVDPSKRLAQTLKGLRSAVFFSATLSPLDYFIDVLGGSTESPKGTYPSPFRSDQMTVRIEPLNISFQARDRTMDSVAESVRKHVRANPGNHLIYCPSLTYLDSLHQKLEAFGIQAVAQRTMMRESEREAFLAKFTNGKDSVGLAVMGGIFAEGIDLPGDQLVGVTIIGVGLPSLSIERDLLSTYFDQKEKAGFDYAYRYPGMQRVLQAVGRLIRSENDQGEALLIDQRFLEERYEDLFPSWWTILPNVSGQETWDD